jgi:hypothetical protein
MSDNNFRDLVAKLNSISEDKMLSESVDGTPYTQTASESVNGAKDTANLLHIFDKLEEASKPDFLDIDGDGDKEEPMKKAVKDKDEDEDEVDEGSYRTKKKVREAEETSQNEDVVSDIRLRYADFLKSEVAQGNELASVTSAVEEGTSTASTISDSFDKMFNMMDRLMKITAEGGVLSKMVDREGGDNSYVTDAFAKLNEAMEALETANMYSMPSTFDEE